MILVDFSIIDDDVRAIIQSLGELLHALSGKTLLITGCSGFLCSYLVDVVIAANDTLLTEPCAVIGVDNLKTGIQTRLSRYMSREDFTFIQQDVVEPIEFAPQIDYIVHGAGVASPVFYRKFPLETIDVNVIGTRQMLDVCLAKQCLSMLYLSTSEVYGSPDSEHIPTPETYWGYVSPTGPRACYDESKRLAETLCMTYWRLHKLPVKIARPFNIYGPGQRLDDGRIIPDLMRAVMNVDAITLYSDGRPTRAFCYIADAVNMLFRLLLSQFNGDVFNVGNDETEISIGQLAEMFSHLVGNISVQFSASSDNDYLTDNPMRRCPDITKARTSFNWSPQIPLEDGLRRTLAFYKGA